MRYRDDISEIKADGSIAYYAKWIGGPTLSKIENCRTEINGDWRATVFITGEPDTFFSIPAVMIVKGVRIKGYVTTDNDGMIFHHCYY